MAWSVIDISYYQSISNYNTLANAVDGVILRCGYRGYGSSGSLNKDSSLETHYTGLRGKTKIGYYWFSQAISDAEAIEEADYVIDTLLAGKTNDMPIYFDSEIADTSGHSGRADNLSKAARTRYCVTWINRIKARGYRAGVYASESWFVSNLDFQQLLNTGASIWVAKYSSTAPSTSTYDAWQWTSSATISGLSGRFDQSTFYVDVAGWGGTVPVTGVTLNKSSITLAISGTERLTATVLPTNATNKNVTWASSNSSIATIVNGLVTGVSSGTCIVGAITEDGGFRATCAVTVSSGITGITLDKTSIRVEKGSTEKLTATIQPPTATPKPITWTSSNTNVAIVDQTGNVTAVGAGNCNITATVETFSASCSTTVVIYPESITLEPTEIEHISGESELETLTLTFTPADCTERDITWVSTNPDIVTYDMQNNRLSYNGDAGECVLTAKDVRDHTAECRFTVYVRAQKPNTPIVASIEQKSIVLQEIEYGEYSIDLGTTWQSNNVFNGLEYNKNYIFVQRIKTHGYYMESEQSDITRAKTKDIVHVESIDLGIDNLVIDMNKDPHTYTFETIITPTDADIKTVLYSVDDTSVGYISSSGKFTATNYGSCNITATSVDGGKTDECSVEVYKKWETPNPPIVTDVNRTSVTLVSDNLTVFSIDGGNVWLKGPILYGLKPNTAYNIICKTLADRYRTESDVSSPTLIVTPNTDPDPSGKILPTSVTLSAHKLYFDLSKNTYATLHYTILPENVSNPNVIWYSSDDSIVKVGTSGEVNAISPGKVLVFIRTIYGAKTDCCECYVYRTIPRPDAPTSKEITMTSIELNTIDNAEYSIDGENWQDSPLFEGLTKDSYYTLYQRIKGIGDYQPPSDSSYGLTVKTLTDEKPGGHSESGYTWGQEVECNNIPVYCSPYTNKSDFKISGKYYIFNLIECKHRIRLSEIEDYVGVYGHSIGWVKVSDLKLIVKDIYVGDKVIVSGDINIYADGSGTFIHKDKDTMYVTDILEDQEYCYGVTTKAGMNHQGFATKEQVIKYESIIVED